MVEFQNILATGMKPLLAMACVSELALLAGYLPAGRPSARGAWWPWARAIGILRSRLLVAIESFPGTPIVAAVVANGLVLIFLGLLHVAFWRFPGAE